MQSTARKNKTITQNMLDMPLQISNESLPPANSNVSSVDLITPIFTGEGIIHDALPQANDNIQHISDYDDNTLLTAGRNNSDNISRAPQIEHSFVKADYEGGNIGYDQFEKIPVTTNEKSAVTHTGTKYHVVYTEEKLANNPAYTVGKTHNNLSSGIRKVRFSGDAEIPGQITHEHPTTAINIPANDNLSSQLSPAILPFGNENVLRNNIMENNNLDTNSNGRKQRFIRKLPASFQ
jgi:hypothetical protein